MIVPQRLEEDGEPHFEGLLPPTHATPNYGSITMENEGLCWRRSTHQGAWELDRGTPPNSNL